MVNPGGGAGEFAFSSFGGVVESKFPMSQRLCIPVLLFFGGLFIFVFANLCFPKLAVQTRKFSFFVREFLC